MFMLIAFLNVFKAWTGRGMGNLNHFGDIFNPFHASVLFLYSLKTSEKLMFPVVFRGYKNGILAWNGLNGNCHIKQATLMKTSLHIRNVSFVSKPKSIFKTGVSLLYKLIIATLTIQNTGKATKKFFRLGHQNRFLWWKSFLKLWHSEKCNLGFLLPLKRKRNKMITKEYTKNDPHKILHSGDLLFYQNSKQT